MSSARTLLRLLALGFLCALAPLAVAQDWKVYDAGRYGFMMLVPSGVTVKEKELGGGWGQIWADSEGVKLNGMAKLGPKATDAEIEAFAVRTIGIPRNEWNLIDSGTGQRGFERFKAFEAVRGKKLYFGGYGVGPRGNYLLFLETTVDDYNAHRADYRKWYDSLRVY